MSLAEQCRDGTISLEAAEEILRRIETEEDNPYGAIDDQDKHGETALRWACSNGRDDLIRLLLDGHADPNKSNDLQQTPLHALCWNQFSHCLPLLLAHPVAIDAKDRDGCTALHKVCWKGNADMAKQLLDAGANVEALDVNGASPLHYAAVQGHEEVVTILVTHNADILHRDKKDISAVQRAAASGRLEVIKILLDRGAPLMDTDAQGLTLLHRVAVKGYYNIAEELIRRGANFRARDRIGATPFHKAAASGNVEILKLLLRNGSDIHADDASGATPLHKACWTNEKAVVTWLLENGAHVDRKDQKLATPLHYASLGNHRAIVRLLLEHKANVHNRDSRGNTPLIDACAKGSLDAIELLVANKANVQAVNKANVPPLLEAIRLKQTEAVRWLLRRFGMEGLGGPEMWQKAVKVAQANNSEAILQLLVQANSTEIIRENIHKNLKVVHQQYEVLRDRLGRAEYFVALLDRHGFYGKSQIVQRHLHECEPLLERLMDGVEDGENCPDNRLHEAEAYREAQDKLRALLQSFEFELTLGQPAIPAEQRSTDASAEASEEASGEGEHSQSSFSSRDDDAEPPMSPEEIQKELDRYKRKQELHEEIEGKLQGVLSKMVQAYPTPGDQSVPEFTLAIEKFNEWKAKVTAEVVENIRRIDMLSRQLHDTLAYGHKLLEEQSKAGTQVITQLVHATLADQEKQTATSAKVEACRVYQDQLRVLLRRAEDREEELLRVELEERIKRDEERRQQAEQRRMASPRYNMTEEEAMRAAEMEVEKYKRQQELDPRIREAKRRAVLQEQREAEAEMRVEFPEEALSVTHPRSIEAVHMTELSPTESPFDDDLPAVEHFPPTLSDFPAPEEFPSPEEFPAAPHPDTEASNKQEEEEEEEAQRSEEEETQSQPGEPVSEQTQESVHELDEQPNEQEPVTVEQEDEEFTMSTELPEDDEEGWKPYVEDDTADVEPAESTTPNVDSPSEEEPSSTPDNELQEE